MRSVRSQIISEKWEENSVEVSYFKMNYNSDKDVL